MMSLNFRKRICWHEAGHAVAAYLQHKDLVVRVQRNDRAGFQGGRCTYNVDVDVLNQSLISASGVAAERLFGKPYDSYDDFILRSNGGESQRHMGDMSTVAEQLRLKESDGVPREVLEQVFEVQVQVAYEKLLPYREAVGRLADAIFKRGVVYGHELPEILGFESPSVRREALLIEELRKICPNAFA